MNRRSLLLTSAGSALTIGPAAAVCSLPVEDPVFGLIAEHERLTRACDASFDDYDRAEITHGSNSPEADAADDRSLAAGAAANAALRSLIATVPATTAGMRAVVAHVYGKGDLAGRGVEQDDLADLLVTVGRFLEGEERK